MLEQKNDEKGCFYSVKTIDPPQRSILLPYDIAESSDSKLDWPSSAEWVEPNSYEREETMRIHEVTDGNQSHIETHNLANDKSIDHDCDSNSQTNIVSGDDAYDNNDDDNDDDDDDDDDVDDNDDDNPAKGHLESGNFLTFQKSIELLLKSESSYEHIPSGKKENVYFVLNNESNISKRDTHSRSDFSDDCGGWNSADGTTPASYYRLDTFGNLQSIYKNKTLGYCRLSRVKGKNGKTERKYIPFDPQPTEDEIVVMHRYYATSNADPNYKKRVSWLGKGGLRSSLAVVEYKGKFPGLIPHGNSKDPESEYIRTPAHVMTEVAELLKSHKPKMVYEQMKKKYDEVTRPSSIQQIRAKKRYDKAKNDDCSMGHTKNVADNIQQLENMVTHNHSYVRAIVRTNGKTPVTILYNDEQLYDIKNICCTGQAVLGVDKTFNLCDIHVTVTCYKQLSVVKDQGDGTTAPPIFLGPVFLHDNSDFETYCAFFHHLKMKLIDANLSKLVIGTDDEAAMVKAMTTAFPESTHVLCTRHLRQNTNQKLLDDAVDKTGRNAILNQIYGKDDILNSDDTICFEEKCSDLEEHCSQVSSKFTKYFTGRLKTLLKTKVNEPVRKDIVSQNWTNNNCESLNHVLKQATDWRSKPLVPLVEKLQDLADGQFKELRSAMLGTGEYKLADSHKQFQMSKTDWVSKTTSQREKAFRRFRKYFVPPKNVMISTDGCSEIIAPRTHGKKLGEKKRKINVRTTTHTKKRKVPVPDSEPPSP